ncbi:MAG: hypothetical protein NVSMB65_21680 [Chloroflexota bacterium]
MMTSVILSARGVPLDRAVAPLDRAVMWLVAALLIGAMAVLVYAAYRLRTSDSGDGTARLGGLPSRELMWIIAPLLLLALFFYLAVRG